MKINVEIDCTPLEARQFFGLPDVQPMQTAVMEHLQKQMISNIEKVSPEALLQSWFTFDPKLAERFSDMFVTMAGLGGAVSDKKPGDKKKACRMTPAPPRRRGAGFGHRASACCWPKREESSSSTSACCCRRCCCKRRAATATRC